MSKHVSRRSVVAGSGTAITGLLGVGSQVLADEHAIPVIIADVNPMEETVVLENIGNDAVDLAGYRIDWEHSEEQTQTDAFEESVTIEAGAQLVVWSGFQSTQIPEVEYDYRIVNHGNGRINDDNLDVVAFLSPGGEVVATSDGEIQPPEPEPPADDGGDDGDPEVGDNEVADDEELEEPDEQGSEEPGEDGGLPKTSNRKRKGRTRNLKGANRKRRKTRRRVYESTKPP